MEAAGAGVAGSHSHSSGAGAERPGSGIGGLGLSPGYVALSPANPGPGSVCASLRLSFCICQPGRSWQLPPQGGREGRWLGRSLWSCACVPWCPIEGHPYPPPPSPLSGRRALARVFHWARPTQGHPGFPLPPTPASPGNGVAVPQDAGYTLLPRGCAPHPGQHTQSAPLQPIPGARFRRSAVPPLPSAAQSVGGPA